MSSMKKRTRRVQATKTDEETSVVEVRFLLKVKGRIDENSSDATYGVNDAVACMIDERIFQHRTNPPDPPESEPHFIDATRFRVRYYGKDFG